MKQNQKSSSNGKESKPKFPSKSIKHDPNAESARAVFGLKDANPKEKD